MRCSEKRFDWKGSLKLEQAYWLRHKERVCSKEWLEHMRERTGWFLDWYRGYGELGKDTKILQIGSGPDGEINFIERGIKIAVDPLTDFYKLWFGQIMSKDVEFLKARGEELPFKDEFFNLVITYNSLDHTEHPSAVLSEIARVLKKGGILYIGVHTKPDYYRFFFERLKRYIKVTDHYHIYTKRLLKEEVEKHPLLVIDERGETELERSAISRGRALKRAVKFILGKKEYTFHILAKKVC